MLNTIRFVFKNPSSRQTENTEDFIEYFDKAFDTFKPRIKREWKGSNDQPNAVKM